MHSTSTTERQPDGTGLDATEDQRLEPRFHPEPDAREAVVVAEDSWATRGRIADVSFSGIGLWLDDVSELSIGQPVELCYRNDRIPTIVKYISLHDRVYRVGLEVESPFDLPPEE
jgi:hypothetical protein